MFETFVLPNQLRGGGKIEKVWGTFSTFFILRSSFPLPFLFLHFSLFRHLYQPIGERCIPFTRALFYGKIEYKILLR